MRTIPGCWTGFRGSSEMPQHRRSLGAADEWVETLSPTPNTVYAPPGMLELLTKPRNLTAFWLEPATVFGSMRLP